MGNYINFLFLLLFLFILHSIIIDIKLRVIIIVLSSQYCWCQYVLVDGITFEAILFSKFVLYSMIIVLIDQEFDRTMVIFVL